MPLGFAKTDHTATYQNLEAVAELYGAESRELGLDERVKIIKQIGEARKEALLRLKADVYGDPKSNDEVRQLAAANRLAEVIDDALLQAATRGEPTIELFSLRDQNGNPICKLFSGNDSDYKPNVKKRFVIISEDSYEGLTRENMLTPAAKCLWDTLEAKCLIFWFTWSGLFVKVP